MRVFHCAHCDQLVFFENSLCLHCLSALGYDPDRGEMVTVLVQQPLASGALSIVGDADGAPAYYRCSNDDLAACNWLVTTPDTLCVSCALTQTRPSARDGEAFALFADAEAAKRRLIYSLQEHGLPLDSWQDHPEGGGLAFDLLSSERRPVMTGHANGLITLDLDEADDVHREKRRAELGEPYRTLLGHFRHEIGHYYWPAVVEQTGLIDDYRTLFGDEREDYGEALQRHYDEGAPADWANQHVSAYATMHPWEDWAETFAHYLHITDTSQTAAAYGLRTADARPSDTADLGIRKTLKDWIPFTYAMNGVCRSMGIADLYPFVLTDAVIKKLVFVDRALAATRMRSITAA